MAKKDPAHTHVRKPTKVRAFEVVTGADDPAVGLRWRTDAGRFRADGASQRRASTTRFARGNFIVQKEHLGTLESHDAGAVPRRVRRALGAGGVHHFGDEIDQQENQEHRCDARGPAKPDYHAFSSNSSAVGSGQRSTQSAKAKSAAKGKAIGHAAVRSNASARENSLCQRADMLGPGPQARARPPKSGRKSWRGSKPSTTKSKRRQCFT
jgi:hypothetical protein